MQIPTPSLETVEAFLAQKRIAMIGISRNSKDFSASLFSELERRGYGIVPVNPKAWEVMGRPCFARVQDIEPPVDGALLMTTPEVTDAVIADCDAAGIRRVWMYRAGVDTPLPKDRGFLLQPAMLASARLTRSPQAFFVSGIPRRRFLVPRS